jgi:hypothetical protein
MNEWMDGWMDGWMDVNAIVNAFSLWLCLYNNNNIVTRDVCHGSHPASERDRMWWGVEFSFVSFHFISLAKA